jgi:signal transduction histidine kinase
MAGLRNIFSLISWKRWLVALALGITAALIAYRLNLHLFRGLRFSALASKDVAGFVALAVVVSLWAFVPSNRNAWLRHAGLCGYAVVVLLLLTGKLFSAVLVENRFYGHEFWFFVVMAQLAGLVVAFLANKGAKGLLKAHHDLAAEKARALRMARAGCDALWTYDVETGALEWDDSFARAFGFDRDDVESSFSWWYSRVHPDDAPALVESFTALSGDSAAESWSGIHRFRRADDSFVWVLARCAFERRDGVMVKAFGGLLDISDRIKVEEELRRRVDERTRELATMTYAVTHDLKSPLSAILGYGEMLATTGAITDSRAVSYLEHIRSGARHMHAIIEDMLGLVRDDSSELMAAPLDIQELFSGLRAEFAIPVERDGGRLRFFAGDFREFVTSRMLLYRVMQNLIGNAVKFSRPGVRPDVIVDVRLAGGTLIITVTDNGVGINHEDIRDIFGMGRRTGNATGVAGYGIGLHSVQRTVARMGGKVHVKSVVGVGSTFTVEIPSGPAPRSRVIA